MKVKEFVKTINKGVVFIDLVGDEIECTRYPSNLLWHIPQRFLELEVMETKEEDDLIEIYIMGGN